MPDISSLHNDREHQSIYKGLEATHFIVEMVMGIYRFNNSTSFNFGASDANVQHCSSIVCSWYVHLKLTLCDPIQSSLRVESTRHQAVASIDSWCKTRINWAPSSDLFKLIKITWTCFLRNAWCVQPINWATVWINGRWIDRVRNRTRSAVYIELRHASRDHTQCF